MDYRRILGTIELLATERSAKHRTANGARAPRGCEYV